MGISERVIAVVGAGLLIAATGGCSRGEADGAEAPAPTVQPTSRVAERLESAIPGITLVALSELPRSPESGAVDEYCEGYRAETLTATGRAVQARGWIVTSEAALGRFRVVSFASGFDPGTSGICTVRNGNIGVFDDARLVALAYATGGPEAVANGKVNLGSVAPLESGALLIWGGDYPAPPLGELHLEGERPRLASVAREQTFCSRAATVPNVYGKSIQNARTALVARGWRPEPADEELNEYDGASRLAAQGVVEAQACSGTGMGFCAFKYRGPGGTLDVTTVGGSEEADNVVVSYDVTCRTP